MNRRCGTALVATGLWLAAVAGCGAGSERPAGVPTATECHTRIIVAFSDAAGVGSVREIAAAADVSLTVNQRLLPGRYVLELGSTEPDTGCVAAIARLRADRRIQFVELDAHRAPHDGE